MTAAFCLLAAWALLLVAPATPIGRMLHRLLVAAPARLAARISRGHVALLVVVAAVVGLVALVLGAEGVRILSMGAPDLAAMATMMDAATLLDAGIAAMLAAASIRLRPLLARLPRWPARRARRAPRSRVTAERHGANDDEDGPARRAA